MFASFPRLAVERLDNRDLMSATFAGATDLFASEYKQEPTTAHVLYQDITIPTNITATGREFVGVSEPTGEAKERVVTIGEFNDTSVPTGKAVLYGRKSGDDKRCDY